MTEQQNWELMGKVYKQEAETLRAELAKKEEEIKYLQKRLDYYGREMPACDCDEYGVKWTERV